MQPLYKLANDYQKLLDLIDNSEDITAEHLDMLGQINEDINTKSNNVGLAIKNIENLMDGIQKEIDSMESRHKRLLKQKVWLVDYLKYNMQKSDIREIKSSNIEIKLRDYKYHLDIYNEQVIPTEYYKTEVKTSISKKSIIDDMKQGVIVPGAQFQTTTSVNIK